MSAESDVANPLLAAWKSLPFSTHLGMSDCSGASWSQVAEATRLLGGAPPGRKPQPTPFLDVFMLRRLAVARFAWAIPNEAALSALANLSPLVEIGAGTGYWAGLLAQMGADVVAYDQNPSGPANRWHPEERRFHPVLQAEAEAAGLHPDRTLFLCWPPYGNDMAERALDAYETAGGSRLALIGESDGATATSAFHRRIGAGCDCGHEWEAPCSCPPSRWRELRTVAIPQWPGLHDYLAIYERGPDSSA